MLSTRQITLRTSVVCSMRPAPARSRSINLARPREKVVVSSRPGGQCALCRAASVCCERTPPLQGDRFT